MSETDMTDYAELRAALAARPAIGPYTVDQDNSDGIVVVDGRGNIVAEANYGDVPSEYGPGVTETIIRGVRSTLLYIAAANPVTTTALLAERDHLAAENARLREALEKIPKGTPVEGEEIMVNTPYDVFTLPLQPSGLLGGPRFVVHVPGPEQPVGGGES